MELSTLNTRAHTHTHTTDTLPTHAQIDISAANKRPTGDEALDLILQMTKIKFEKVGLQGSFEVGSQRDVPDLLGKGIPD